MKHAFCAVALAVAAACSTVSAHAASATVTIFGNYIEGSGDIALSNPVGSYITPMGPSISLGDGAPSNDPLWPGAGQSFGASVTGFLVVEKAGMYSITMGSDDGSYLFLGSDSTAALSLPGTRGYSTTNGAFQLAAGATPFRVSYFNGPCCGAQFTLESTATITPVPEPGTYALIAGGLGLVGGVTVVRRRRTSAG
jgi:hypothetical protein